MKMIQFQIFYFKHFLIDYGLLFHTFVSYVICSYFVSKHKTWMSLSEHFIRQENLDDHRQTHTYQQIEFVYQLTVKTQGVRHVHNNKIT